MQLLIFQKRLHHAGLEKSIEFKWTVFVRHMKMLVRGLQYLITLPQMRRDRGRVRVGDYLTGFIGRVRLPPEQLTPVQGVVVCPVSYVCVPSLNTRLERIFKREDVDFCGKENIIIQEKHHSKNKFLGQSLPLKTKEQLNEFEEKLTDKEVAAKLESFCHSVGGKNHKHTLEQILSKIFEDVLAKNVHGLATVITYP
ncbi:hypothetical protein NQ317_012214 [Molorchus minor]|uniref:Uncharacterized protein n=1 Tax=Molorchus minor TaxID=1323400 RepID=A0ABQ9IYK7_9CUCU|nr:hypothetical protein NQ317_012214 [Molorchus minor]